MNFNERTQDDLFPSISNCYLIMLVAVVNKMAEDLSSKDSDEELNDSDWEEMETDGESILCLFCSNLYRYLLFTYCHKNGRKVLKFQ